MFYINEQDLFAGYNVYNYENIFGGGEEGETPIIEEIEVFITIKK